MPGNLIRGYKNLLIAFSLIALGQFPVHAFSEETSLFSSDGKAAAYIAFEDEPTIYSWDGKPVAYLDSDPTGGFHVYAFNGQHLGWFVGGYIRDHEGNATCGTARVMRSTGYEPYKAYKEYKPYKSYKAYAPYRPYFSRKWSTTTCSLFLQGSAAR
jgi:hypothetical protein